MSETTASRAILMFCTEPRMWIDLYVSGYALCLIARFSTHVSARTIRVLLAFSIVNLTLPPSPAIRPKY